MAGVVGGNAKIFRVTVILEPGWSNMDIKLTGDSNQGIRAVGARIVDSGTVAYFPPTWAVYSVEGWYRDSSRGVHRLPRAHVSELI